MMAMSRNPNEYAFVHALQPSGGRRRLTPQTMTAIGIAAALHVGLLTYIYEQKFATPLVAEPADHPITITTQPWPKTPPRPAPPTHTATIRPTDHVILTPNTPTIPVPDTKPERQIDDGPIINTRTAPPSEGPPVISNPDWISRPSAAQMGAYFPPAALDDQISGKAVITCSVTATGSVTGCAVASETPAGRGFGKAAVKLSQFFRLSPRTVNGHAIDGALVTIPLVFDAGG